MSSSTLGKIVALSLLAFAAGYLTAQGPARAVASTAGAALAEEEPAWEEDLHWEVADGTLRLSSASGRRAYVVLGTEELPSRELRRRSIPSGKRGVALRLKDGERVLVATVTAFGECTPRGCKPCVCGAPPPPEPVVLDGFYRLEICERCDEPGCLKPPECS